jgi:methanogenic corrinoid protein MtbC1
MTDTVAPRPGAQPLEIDEYADLLWDAVIGMEERSAVDVAVDALSDGLDPEALLLDVVGGVQRRIGRAWADNTISVAQEHAATAINERVVASLAGHLPRPRADRGRVTIACVDGEWHAMATRLLAEVLTLRGFRVDYLGAQVPTPHLITHLHRTSPDVVALSASLPTRLPVAHATITACQSAGVPVVVGGAAFGPDGSYARLLGAQGWAPDARAAADLLAEGRLARPKTLHEPIDDLPHLADQEYTMVSRSSGRLVRAMLAGLEERVPAMRDYDEAQRQHTIEDLAHIVDFLAAALYVGQGPLFSTFLLWTADVLAARGVPAFSLLPALDLLAGELRDFPRATALLTHARQALVARAA